MNTWGHRETARSRAEWILLWNPTKAADLNWSAETNSGIDFGVAATGDPTACTLTGGYRIDGGYIAAGFRASGINIPTENALRLGSKIDGTPDEIILAVRPLGANADVYGGITWRETS